MTARVMFNDFGRWQLRGAVEKLRRVDPQSAREFLNEVEILLRSPKKLLEREAPIDGFPEFPAREVRLGSYRVLVRHTDEATWVVGVWPIQRESST